LLVDKHGSSYRKNFVEFFFVCNDVDVNSDHRGRYKQVVL
jgi:hypothetical protein